MIKVLRLPMSVPDPALVTWCVDPSHYDDGVHVGGAPHTLNSVTAQPGAQVVIDSTAGNAAEVEAQLAASGLVED